MWEKCLVIKIKQNRKAGHREENDFQRSCTGRWIAVGLPYERRSRCRPCFTHFQGKSCYARHSMFAWDLVMVVSSKNYVVRYPSNFPEEYWGKIKASDLKTTCFKGILFKLIFFSGTFFNTRWKVYVLSLSARRCVSIMKPFSSQHWHCVDLRSVWTLKLCHIRNASSRA